MAETLFSSYSDANPVDPPAGFSELFNSGDARVSSGQWYAVNATQATWFDDTVLSADDIFSEVKIALITSDSRGPGLMSTAGNGYILLVRNTDLRLFLYNAGVLGAQVGSTITRTNSSDELVRLGRTNSTGVMPVLVNGVSVGSFTNNTHTSDLKGVCFSRGGRLSEFRTGGAAATASITNINGDDTVVQGSTGNNILTALATVTSLTIGGVAVTLTAVDANNNTWPMPGFVDGAAYPVFGTVTASINAGEATRDVVLSMAAGYTARTMGTLSAADDSIATLAAAQGLTMATGGVLYNSAGLTTYDDSTISDADDGTHILWYRAPSTNVMTQINLLVADGVIVTGRLTLRAMTVRALTMDSLTTRAP